MQLIVLVQMDLAWCVTVRWVAEAGREGDECGVCSAPDEWRTVAWVPAAC